MSIQTIESDNRSSTIVDDSMSIMMRDLSDSTITSRTSSSWHSIESDIPSRNNILFVRSQLINLCLKYCSIEPDIRLTTAQEWKLRTCIRHLLSLCNVPIKVTCTKTKQLNTILSENESIQFSHNKVFRFCLLKIDFLFISFFKFVMFSRLTKTNNRHRLRGCQP